MKTRTGLALTALLLLGCQQSGGNTPSISKASAVVQTKANAAFAAAQAAISNAAVYSCNATSASPDTSVTGLSVVGTSTPSGSKHTFNEVVTMTDYDPTGSGIMAANDVTMKGTVDPGVSGAYTFTGDLFLEGTVASGAVSLDLSVKTSGAAVSYSGTVTVDGTEYTYAGSQ